MDHYYEDDYEFRAEFAARDRVGGEIEEGLDLFGKSIFRGIESDPVQRFYTGVESAAKQLIRENYFNLGKMHQINLLRGIRKFNYPAYKNPMGTVLGFYVTSGGEKINSEKWRNVLSFMSEVTDMDQRDLLRYCRLWQTR
ncbi:unknown [Singapore grouper iridovirus]|uniref:Uncharacterized protein n=1 Tax=Singapore grouper iridovirus TaxID=262968 RepID=Q5YFP4_9VIRU|nr:hypothetical protein ORF021L [Singapore grouper iridovirus]AAS18036.1 unknown [Singapore grouper iridovirus]WAU86730.1 hypothetical protein ORF021L [Singapore grouper iridovirus]